MNGLVSPKEEESSEWLILKATHLIVPLKCAYLVFSLQWQFE
jgi:hypothetical protein